MTMKPIHRHDCDACEFLGTVHGLEANPRGVDFYVHVRGAGRMPEYTARYGSGGADYVSVRLDCGPMRECTHSDGTRRPCIVRCGRAAR